MQVKNNGTNTANNVLPAALVLSGSGSASLVSAPNSTPVGAGAQASFTWVYTVISAPGTTIAFNDTVSGTDAVDGVIDTSTQATSNTFLCSAATMTQTPTVTVTPTYTATAFEVTGPVKVGPPKPGPNPFNPILGNPLRVWVNITPSDIDSITLKIYTAAYRLIREQVFDGTEAQEIAMSGILQYDSSNLVDLSEGAYYYVVIAEKGGVKVRSKIDKIIILK
jgi:hypothetical protein